MGNRAYGKGMHDGIARGRAEGIQIGRRENTWQGYVASALGAVVIVAGNLFIEKRRERKAAARAAATKSAPTE